MCVLKMHLFIVFSVVGQGPPDQGIHHKMYVWYVCSNAVALQWLMHVSLCLEAVFVQLFFNFRFYNRHV